MDELDLFCCQNPHCSDYGLRGQGNLRVAFRYRQGTRRMLACRTCQQRFSERKGTALFGSRLAHDRALAPDSLWRFVAVGEQVRQAKEENLVVAVAGDGQEAPVRAGGQDGQSAPAPPVPTDR